MNQPEASNPKIQETSYKEAPNPKHQRENLESYSDKYIYISDLRFFLLIDISSETGHFLTFC